MPKSETDPSAPLTPAEIASLQSAAQGGPGGTRVTLWTRLIAEHAARGRRIAELERLLDVVDHSVGAALERIDAARPLAAPDRTGGERAVGSTSRKRPAKIRV